MCLLYYACHHWVRDGYRLLIVGGGGSVDVPIGTQVF
jgi:hypothetical protein